MRYPSLTMQASKAVWQKGIQQLLEEQCISATFASKVHKAWDALSGTTWHTLSQENSAKKHHLNIEFPEQAVHAQESLGRRST
jgi:hypothetical protein